MPTTPKSGREASLDTPRVSNSFDSVCSFIAPVDLRDILSSYEDYGCIAEAVHLLWPQMAWPCGLGALYCVLLFPVAHMTATRWEPAVSRNPEHGNLEFTEVQLVHACAMVAFAVTLSLSLFDFFWARERVKKQTSLWVSYVHGVSLATYAFKFYQGNPFMEAPRGGEVDFLRIFYWMFSTPGTFLVTGCLVVNQKSEGNQPSGRRLLILTLVSDLMMFVLGFCEECLRFPWHQVSFLGSVLCFVWTMQHFKRLLERGASTLAHQHDRDNLLHLHHFTLALWTGFPLLRLVEIFGILSNDQREIGYTILDLLSKLVFSLALLVVNYSITDKMMANNLRLTKMYLERQAAQNIKRDIKAIGDVPNQLDRKSLAYSEAEAWGRLRLESMHSEGYCHPRAQALLESTMSEYVALSSGNLGTFLSSTKTRKLQD